MRKVTQNAVNAFTSGNTMNEGNTSVERHAIVEVENKTFYDAVVLKLHGHIIAMYNSKDGLWIRDAGWNTPTTRARLNGLPNVSVGVKAGVLYLNGGEWDGKWHHIWAYCE